MPAGARSIAAVRARPPPLDAAYGAVPPTFWTEWTEAMLMIDTLSRRLHRERRVLDAEEHSAEVDREAAVEVLTAVSITGV